MGWNHQLAFFEQFSIIYDCLFKNEFVLFGVGMRRWYNQMQGCNETIWKLYLCYFTFIVFRSSVAPSWQNLFDTFSCGPNWVQQWFRRGSNTIEVELCVYTWNWSLNDWGKCPLNSHITYRQKYSLDIRAVDPSFTASLMKWSFSSILCRSLYKMGYS